MSRKAARINALTEQYAEQYMREEGLTEKEARAKAYPVACGVYWSEHADKVLEARIERKRRKQQEQYNEAVAYMKAMAKLPEKLNEIINP